MSEVNTTQLQDWIQKMRQGDAYAQNELLGFACDRLQRLARKMLKGFQGVRRWEQTDDIVQKAAVRLWRALQTTTPESLKHFFNLATTQIRRELIDLSRHYLGPEGLGGNHATNHAPGNEQNESRSPSEEVMVTDETEALARWTEFHEQVSRLPDEERLVFDCLWYAGLTQAETCKLLQIPERTLQRRWQRARLRLHESLKENLPE